MVKSNLVKRPMDFAAQNSNVDFQPSDFQDERDSIVLVRERTKGSNLESAFAKKWQNCSRDRPHHRYVARSVKEKKAILNERYRKGDYGTKEEI